MATPNTAGTPIKAIFYGIPFEVMADCKPNTNLTGFTVEASASSGQSIFKRVRQPKYVKGIDIKCSVQEYNVLGLAVAAAMSTIGSGPQVLMYADRSTVAGPGRINLGDHDGSESKASIDVFFDDIVVTAG